MGGCGCNSGAPTGFGSIASQGEQATQDATVLNQSSRAMNAAQEQAVAAGAQQSFTLRDRSGSVQHFGSALERNAFMARSGGTII